MRITGLAVDRPIATAMVFLIIITIGVMGFRFLPVDLLPPIEYPQLTVRTNYPNVGPEEIERLRGRQVSYPPHVERALAALREMMVEDRFGEAGHEVVIEEFTARHRRGENPSVEEYVHRYPEAAEERPRQVVVVGLGLLASLVPAWRAAQPSQKSAGTTPSHEMRAMMPARPDLK